MPWNIQRQGPSWRRLTDFFAVSEESAPEGSDLAGVVRLARPGPAQKPTFATSLAPSGKSGFFESEGCPPKKNAHEQLV